MRDWLVLLTLLTSCSPVESSPGAGPATNVCPLVPCRNYVQTGPTPQCDAKRGICTAGSAAVAGGANDRLSLVVTTPESSRLPGYTFVVSDVTHLFSPRSDACPDCRNLGYVSQRAGVYAADIGAAGTVNFNLGHGDNDQIPTRSVPIRATFRHQLQLSDNGRFVDASDLGIDVQPIVAPLAYAVPGTAPGPSTTDTSTNPAPSIGYDARLPYVLGLGGRVSNSYEAHYAPLSPFDVAFPPIIESLPPKTSQECRPSCQPETTRLTNQTGALVHHPVTVVREGEPSLNLDGFRLFLRESRTRRTVSSSPVLAGPAQVTLFTFGLSDDTLRAGLDMVLAPPPPGPGETKLPDLVLAISGGFTGAVPYPLLPALMHLQGAVVSPLGAPVPAYVTLLADEVTTLRSSVTLEYEEELITEQDGSFALKLRPGTYTAIITPYASTGLGKTITKLKVPEPSIPGEEGFLGGVSLAVTRTVILEGTVRTSDGRVLVGAEVEAHASVALRHPPNPNDSDPRKWPRSVSVPTNEQGAFSLPLDPDMLFDLVVRPPPGTNLPWVISTEIPTTGPLDPRVISIPVPSVASAVLNDDKGDAVANAIVRAYRYNYFALPARSNDPSGRCETDAQCPSTAPHCAVDPGDPSTFQKCLPAVAIEVGRAVTDARGAFTLYLDPTTTADPL